MWAALYDRPFPFYATVAIMKKYVVLEKAVGQTPLECAELWRAAHTEFTGVPLAYAGRLDPMASGKLLILIRDECKVQERYHNLDKEYEFSVLFGVSSDTADVLGRLRFADLIPKPDETTLRTITADLVGDINLPYPHFSSKTINGKPLHVWTLEGRLNEIEIPTKESTIYKLKLTKLETKTRQEIHTEVSEKIESIKPVTEASKALGNDFRRVDVRADWKKFIEIGNPTDTFTIATFTCIASSGTYMRTLAEVIAKELNTTGLAYHIHRTKIGQYKKLPFCFSFWRKIF
jgi:tRNA pseudouridine(55) synthase